MDLKTFPDILLGLVFLFVSSVCFTLVGVAKERKLNNRWAQENIWLTTLKSLPIDSTRDLILIILSLLFKNLYNYN